MTLAVWTILSWSLGQIVEDSGLMWMVQRCHVFTNMRIVGNATWRSTSFKHPCVAQVVSFGWSVEMTVTRSHTFVGSGIHTTSLIFPLTSLMFPLACSRVSLAFIYYHHTSLNFSIFRTPSQHSFMESNISKSKCSILPQVIDDHHRTFTMSTKYKNRDLIR